MQKVKLIMLNDKKIDFSKMFYKCSYLKECLLIPSDERKKNEITEKQINNQIRSSNEVYSLETNTLSNNFLEDFRQINDKSYSINKCTDSLIYIKNKISNIYISFKNDFFLDKKEQISQIFSKSHDFL